MLFQNEPDSLSGISKIKSATQSSQPENKLVFPAKFFKWLLAAIFLTAAAIAVPIANKLGLGSVLGYLMAGIIIGPFGLSLIGDIEEVMHFTEFGVVMMVYLDEAVKRHRPTDHKTLRAAVIEGAVPNEDTLRALGYLESDD